MSDVPGPPILHLNGYTIASPTVLARQPMTDERLRHRPYTREYGEDSPDVTDWRWSSASRRTLS